MNLSNKEIEKALKEDAAATAAYQQWLKEQPPLFPTKPLPDPAAWQCSVERFLNFRNQIEVTVKFCLPADVVKECEATANAQAEAIKATITRDVQQLDEYKQAHDAYLRLKHNHDKLASIDERLAEVAEAEQQHLDGTNPNFDKSDATHIVASLQAQRDALQTFDAKLYQAMVERSNQLAVKSGIVGSQFAHDVRMRLEECTKSFVGGQEQLVQLVICNLLAGHAPSLTNHALKVVKDATPELPVNPAKPTIVPNPYVTNRPPTPPPMTRKELIQARQQALDNAPAKAEPPVPMDEFHKPLVMNPHYLAELAEKEKACLT